MLANEFNNALTTTLICLTRIATRIGRIALKPRKNVTSSNIKPNTATTTTNASN